MCESLVESCRDLDAPVQRRILPSPSPVEREVDPAALATAVVTLRRTTNSSPLVVGPVPRDDVVRYQAPQTSVQDAVFVIVAAATC